MKWLDEDGYPTKKALKRVRNAPPEEIVDVLRKAWNRQIGGCTEKLRPEEREVVGVETGKRYLRLATGGWSGNEDVIEAYFDNRIARALTWRLSDGGLHILEVPDWVRGTPSQGSDVVD